MAKSKPWLVAYVEPPPTADSSRPGKGVWSTTSGIPVVDNTRHALRQAIFDALNRLPLELTATLSPLAMPSELRFDAWYSHFLAEADKSPLRFMTSWWQTTQDFRRLLRNAGHERLSEASASNERYITGTAELHIERSWRFAPGHQPMKVVRAGILDAFTREVDRELSSVYSEIKRPGRSSRRNLDRDATRLVLRRFLGLSLDEIKDYEAGYEVTLDNGRTLVRSDLDADDEEHELLDQNYERQVHDTIDQSIRNLERDAVLSFPPLPKGRPPTPVPLDDATYRDFLSQDE